MKEKSRVYINKDKNYISYNHPTKRNEKNHVKQITRSIKNSKPEDVTILCNELDELLKNFDIHTKDFSTIETAKVKFTTKAFQWIVQEEIENNPKRITNNTAEKYITITDLNTNILFNPVNKQDNILKNYIANNIYNNNEECTYIVVNTDIQTQYSAVFEFKSFEDLEQDIINKLVHVITDFFVEPITNDIQQIFNYYIKIELEKDDIKLIEKYFNEINTSYIKLYKVYSFNFHNYIITRLQNENQNLVKLIYEILTRKITSNTEFLSDKSSVSGNIELNSKIHNLNEIPRILSIDLKYIDKAVDDELKLLYFDILEKVFSVSNVISNIRLSGNFSEYNKAIECEVKQPIYTTQNIIDYSINHTLTIPIDGILTCDYELTKLFEKIIILGLFQKCNFIFLSNSKVENYDILKENLIKMLSKSESINPYKYLYVNEFIFTQTTKNLYDNKAILNYDIYDNLNGLIDNINKTFEVKVTEYFNSNSYNYISKKNIQISIKELLLESFMYSLYSYLLNPEKLVFYGNIGICNFIIKYNKFLDEVLLDIKNKLDKIVTISMNYIYKSFENITDYNFNKTAISTAILTDIIVPYSYVKELCEKFEKIQGELK